MSLFDSPYGSMFSGPFGPFYTLPTLAGGGSELAFLAAYYDGDGIEQLMITGTGTPTSTHAATVDANDYEGNPQTFGVDEPVWKWGRVTGAVGSRVVYNTEVDGVTLLSPQPMLVHDATITNTWDAANHSNDAGYYLEVDWDGTAKDILELGTSGAFLSVALDGTLTLTDGTNSVSMPVTEGINSVGYNLSAGGSAMQLSSNGEWSAETAFDGSVGTGDIIATEDIRNFRGYTFEDYKPPESGGVDADTILMVHSDTTDGSLVIEDSSVVNNTIVQWQSLAHSTLQKKFGASSLYNEGSNWGRFYITDNTPFNFGLGEFTVDMWYRPTELPGDQILYDHSGVLVIMARTNGSVLVQIAGLNKLYGVAGDITVNNWSHIAVTRVGVNSYLFIDGVLVDTDNGSGADLSSTYQISVGANRVGQWWMHGFLDEIRVSTVARWTESFTPPNEPYKSTLILNDFGKIKNKIDQLTSNYVVYDGQLVTDTNSIVTYGV